MKYQHNQRTHEGYSPDPLFVVIVTAIIIGTLCFWIANLWWEVPKETLMDYRHTNKALMLENQQLKSELHDQRNNNDGLAREIERLQDAVR